MSIFYRVRQFAQAVTARNRPVDRALLSKYLSSAEVELFLRQSAALQQHGLRVLRALEPRWGDDSVLMKAALLHDVGKTGGRIRLWHRIANVLLDAVSHRLRERVAAGEAEHVVDADVEMPPGEEAGERVDDGAVVETGGLDHEGEVLGDVREDDLELVAEAADVRLLVDTKTQLAYVQEADSNPILIRRADDYWSGDMPLSRDGATLKAAALALGYVSEEEFDKLVRPESMV